ncbi:MAG: hypothetical protein AB7O24_14370 [Kofleriaceae bacterium]
MAAGHYRSGSSNALPDAAIVGGDFNTNPWTWPESLVPLTATEAIVGQQLAAFDVDHCPQPTSAEPVP